MAIEQILDLEQLEINIFRGTVLDKVAASRGRTFGGHVAGQTLVSAVRTVDPTFSVHSLHGYFLRPGDPTVPIIFLVERVRDGGSFSTRRVIAVQHGLTIFDMSASFQIAQNGVMHQDVMPTVPAPDDLPFREPGGAFDVEAVRQFAEWDVRIVPGSKMARIAGEAAQQQVWFRHRDRLPDNRVLHVCALAYMSDLTLLLAGLVPHGDELNDVQISSLDHAMWFMRPFRADEWLLYDQSSPSACGGRALTQGKIYDRGGAMVAAVMQEGLTRYVDERRTGAIQ